MSKKVKRVPKSQQPSLAQRVTICEHVLNEWISRPWWRRFLGLGPKGWTRK